MRRKPVRRLVNCSSERTQRSYLCPTYSNGDIDILSKQNPLRLNHEEVDELLNVVGHALQRGLGDGKVSSWPELGGEAPSESRMPNDFRSGRSTKCHVGELEEVADQVEVSGSEDEGNSESESDTGCARVLPAQEAVEHAVVVYSSSATPSPKRTPRTAYG